MYHVIWNNGWILKNEPTIAMPPDDSSSDDEVIVAEITLRFSDVTILHYAVALWEIVCI